MKNRLFTSFLFSVVMLMFSGCGAYEDALPTNKGSSITATATEFKEQGRARDAANWYRSNPHRMHLGCIGLEIDGLTPHDIKDARQKLDMWNGMIAANFKAKGAKYSVKTVCHPERDMVAGIVTADKGKAAIKLRFPYPTGKHSDDACDWQQNDKHQTELVRMANGYAVLKRTLDKTTYFVSIRWEENAELKEKEKNYWVLTAESKQLTYSCEFLSEQNNAKSETFLSVATKTAKYWQKFWNGGAAVDFSQCKDKRAKELERRVVLSQYLLAIQCCGNTPPQETGLTYNSWFGKFHMEMIWWHQSWLPLWGHEKMLERTLRWYISAEPKALEIAMRQGFKGIRWMKMTDPSGEEAPSKVGSYWIWQQPHLIYLAEMVYRNLSEEDKKDLLVKYGRLIDETAEFMADGSINPSSPAALTGGDVVDNHGWRLVPTDYLGNSKHLIAKGGHNYVWVDNDLGLKFGSFIGPNNQGDMIITASSPGTSVSGEGWLKMSHKDHYNLTEIMRRSGATDFFKDYVGTIY